MAATSMKYRIRCLTPLLVGDGNVLSPIDYMVWRDQVNVLDQPRIFRLLAKSPRLDVYLREIKKATRLEFASWGGFAQNFACRRIPFDEPRHAALWANVPPEQLSIPTFVRDTRGPYLPGSAIKGALRTAFLGSRYGENLADTARRLAKSEIPPRWGCQAEDALTGKLGASVFKVLRISDSQPLNDSALRIYLTRVAVLARSADGALQLRWKLYPKGSVEASKINEAAVTFAEMAPPATVFEGHLSLPTFYRQEAIAKELGWKDTLSLEELLAATNDWAGKVLENQWSYARAAGLNRLAGSIESLRLRVEEARKKGSCCVLCMGWGAGYLSKSALPDPRTEKARQVLNEVAAYARVLQSALPFPKTRRIIFSGDEPAALPGWVWLEVEPSN